LVETLTNKITNLSYYNIYHLSLWKLLCNCCCPLWNSFHLLFDVTTVIHIEKRTRQVNEPKQRFLQTYLLSMAIYLLMEHPAVAEIVKKKETVIARMY